MVAAATRGYDPRLRALAIPAAVLQSTLLCPPPAPQEPLPPWGLPSKGGQCRTFYRVFGAYKITNASSCQVVEVVTGGTGVVVLGPVSSEKATDTTVNSSCNSPVPRTISNSFTKIIDGNGGFISSIGGGWPALGDFDYIVGYQRLDGLADNCGDEFPPPVLPPGPPYPVPPETPDGDPFIPEWRRDDPYDPGGGRPPLIIPIIVPPIILKPDISFPITVPITVNGMIVGSITIQFNGEFNVTFGPPAVPYDDSEIKALLKEIRDCACAGGGGTVIETIQLPVLQPEGCSTESVQLSVAAGAYTTAISNRVQATVAAAIVGCEAVEVAQEPETLLSSGTAPNPPVEQFVTGITPEIVSVRLQITAFNSEAEPVTTFPAAGQRKFGSIAFSLPPARAGGDYVYVYDLDTYLRLPVHNKEGVIRLLLKAGTGWQLYDTGERD